jgi:two-component sensor histidine kinase
MPSLTSGEREDAALSLTAAVVGSSHAPLLLLDQDLNVLIASLSFRHDFGLAQETVVGKSVLQIGDGEWNVPELSALLTSTAAGNPASETCEFDLRRPGVEARCLSVHAQRLSYLDLDAVRLLVAVTDVTDAHADAKARKQLSRENALLLQEVRHRIANSLQIIASVLLQGARRAQSEETRGHLQAAHHRVMSVAALERQLAASVDDHGQIRVYLSRLCASIGESMIQEPERIGIEVVADDAELPANLLVSLGLITTELVINALKYAFPAGRSGKITVAYSARGESWTLSVNDDGVGMKDEPGSIIPGLGTSIVRALAAQVGATIDVAQGRPGVTVTVVHKPKAERPHAAAQAVI